MDKVADAALNMQVFQRVKKIPKINHCFVSDTFSAKFLPRQGEKFCLPLHVKVASFLPFE